MVLSRELYSHLSILERNMTLEDIKNEDSDQLGSYCSGPAQRWKELN